MTKKKTVNGHKPRIRVESGGKMGDLDLGLTSTKPVAQSRERAFEFSASSNEPTISTLKPKDHVAPRMPTVFYTPEAWDTVWFIVGVCPQEVGWLGLVDTLPSGDFLITEVFVPEQQVHGTETDISPDAMTDLAMHLIDMGHDTNKLIYWGHSHVNMGVSPSGQDERQVDEYLEHAPLFIRGIYNKRGERKLDVFDRERGLIFQKCPDRIYSPGLTAAAAADLRATLQRNVHPARAAVAQHSTKSWVPPARADFSRFVKRADDEEDDLITKLNDPFYAGKP